MALKLTDVSELGNINVTNIGSGNSTITLKSTTGGDPTIVFNSAAANRSGVLNFQDNGTQSGQIVYNHNGDHMRFYTGGASSSSHLELALNESAGAIFRTQVQATNYFDKDNTAYYLNPAGTSNLNDVEAVQLAIDSYIYHKGDTHTYFGFSGNDAFAMVFEGTTRLSVADSTDPVYSYNAHINMNNKDIDYVNQLHFGSNVRFYDQGDDSYLNFKFGDTGNGGIKFIDGSGNLHGYFYADGDDSIGILDSGGSWAVQVDNDVITALKVADVYRVKATTSGVELSGATTVSGNITANQFVDAQDTAFYANPAATSIMYDIKDGNDNGYVTYQMSTSDFADGTLVSTDIVSNTTNGDSFVIHVHGKSYTGAPPFAFKAQGYLYNNTVINYGGVSYGKNILTANQIKVLDDSNGKLAFWWPRVSYWNNFEVRVVASNSADGTRNRVTTIANATEPSSSKKVTITLSQAMILGQNYGSGAAYASAFYDQDSTGYYVNPAGASNIGGNIAMNNNSLNSVGGLTLNNGWSLTQGGSNYAQVNSWIYLQNNTGLYAPGNGAHIYPNTGSDYGAWRIAGARNGWNGITFDGSSSTFNTLMAAGDGGTMGLYNDTDNEWYFEGVRNGMTGMYYNGTRRLETTNAGSKSTGRHEATTDVRAPLFYDSASTGYYVDPAGFSQMSHIDFNGVITGTAAGAAQIGRNHAYDTVELKGYGAEMMIGAQYNVIHINYRTCNNNTSSHTPQTWYWRDGTSSGFSNHEFDRVTGHESVRSPIFYDSNDTAYYVNPASSSVLNSGTFNGMVVVGSGGTSQWGEVEINTSTTAGWGSSNSYPYLGSDGGSSGSMIMLHNPHIPYRTDNERSGASGMAGIRMAIDTAGSAFWDMGLTGDAFEIWRNASSAQMLSIDSSGNGVFAGQLTSGSYLRALDNYQITLDAVSAGGPVIQFGATNDWDQYGSIGHQGGDFMFTSENRDYTWQQNSTQHMQLKTNGELDVVSNITTQNTFIYINDNGTKWQFGSKALMGNNRFGARYYDGSNWASTAFSVQSNGNFAITGALSKGSGSFKIDHPIEAKKDTHYLVHSFVEAPQADNIYRGKVDLVDGKAEINIDTAAGMTEGTFVLLNTNIQCFTTNESNWDLVKGNVAGNKLTIESKNASSTASISWMVVGERQDQHMKDTDWTDDNGKVLVEPRKEYNPDGSLK